MDMKNHNSMGYLSVETNSIRAIVSKDEIISMFEVAEGSDRIIPDYNFHNTNTVLITISDPVPSSEEREPLDDKFCNKFNSHIKVKFWDRTQCSEDGVHDIIDIDTVKLLADFITEHKKSKFIINCNAGISRSAGVGLLVEYIVGKYKTLYEFRTSYDDVITKHFRYAPNLTVLDQYIKYKEAYN